MDFSLQFFFFFFKSMLCIFMENKGNLAFMRNVSSKSTKLCNSLGH